MPEIRPNMVGQRFWFEYHCYEGHDSADAVAWYHSHQECTVISEADGEDVKDWTFTQRCEDGMPLVYRVRFDDGVEWDVFEDELLDSPKQFERPAPPKGPEDG